ncbi:hypothetical protein RhiLY_10673 [Ceratobasidium sp. AG-Ba]|nr:hypothetical protein RhiLY_10673 [Ceratobasidium sp. AG-Ba]
MSNQGPLPIQAVEPEAGNPPASIRYVMIYVQKFNTKDLVTGTKKERCTTPIEKKQARLCIPNATFLSEVDNLEELAQATRFTYVANDILKSDIHELGGWDLVGYTFRITPKSESKPKPQLGHQNFWGQELGRQWIASRNV